MSKKNLEKLFKLSGKVAILVKAASVMCSEINKFPVDIKSIKTVFFHSSDMYTKGTGGSLLVEGGVLT